MMIGLLSDTHGFLDNKTFNYFEHCDEIWHAGDIGDLAVADALERWKPLRAVFGNVDGRELQARYPEDLHFTCEGMKVWMTHIAGSPPKYNPRVRKLLGTVKPDIFICGHSHILKVGRDAAHNNMLFINAGAAGNHGFHVMKTMIRFEILKAEVRNMEVIELGKRGTIPNS